MPSSSVSLIAGASKLPCHHLLLSGSTGAFCVLSVLPHRSIEGRVRLKAASPMLLALSDLNTILLAPDV